MKTYYKYMWMALFSLFILGACSSGSDELPEPQPKPEPDKITLSSTNLTTEAKGGTGTLIFTSNKSWTASSNQSWCKLDKTSGTSGTTTLNLTWEANSTNQERTAQITIKAGTATATATVKQAKKEAEGGEQGGQQGGEETSGNTIEDMQNKNW